VSKKVRAILADLRRRLQALYGPRLAALVLYGSHARDEAAPGSDIDVLVALTGPVSPCAEIARTAEIVSDVSLEHGETVACAFVSQDQYAREQSPLLLNVRRAGVPV